MWTRDGRFASKMGQIGPQIGQIRDFFRSDFSTFGSSSQMYWNLIWKSPGFVQFGVQSNLLWSQTYHPCTQDTGMWFVCSCVRGLRLSPGSPVTMTFECLKQRYPTRPREPDTDSYVFTQSGSWFTVAVSFTTLFAVAKSLIYDLNYCSYCIKIYDLVHCS